MPDNDGDKLKIEKLVGLLKKGEPQALLELRTRLGKSRDDLAEEIGVPSVLLEAWENEEIKPGGFHQAMWKIRLGSCIDEKISAFLGTQDIEVITSYWALLWDLV